MSHQAVAKPKLRRTPHEEVGPMYPVVKPVDRGFDLTVNPANGEQAKGQVVYLSGRVLDTTGAPIAGAHVELWQTNMHGRYDHPADPNPAPLDGNDDASVLRRGSPLYFDWLDAGRVLVHAGDGADAFVGQLGLNGATIGGTAAGTGIFRPAVVSRDGRYLAYARATTATCSRPTKTFAGCISRRPRRCACTLAT